MAAETARGLALGTGSRASALSSSALAYSPAGLALGTLYHIEGNVDYLAGYDTVALGGAVIDSSTSKVGAGIGLRGFLSGGNGFDGLDGRLGLALPLSDSFSLGVSGRYINLSSHSEAQGKLAQGFTMDASLRLTPGSGLQIDVAALNFIDLHSPYAPVTLTGSLVFLIASGVTAGADVLLDMTTFSSPQATLGGGLEYLGGGSVPFRVGYAVDLARAVQMITGGLGYTDDPIGLDIGLRQEIYGGNDTRVMASVRYSVH